VDVREDVGQRPRDRQRPDAQDEQGQHDERVGTVQRYTDNPHDGLIPHCCTARASPVQRVVTAVVPERSYNGTISMPVSLSIKNVPDEIVERLRDRAAQNKRSLQCELLDIVESAAGRPVTMTIDELYERAKRRKLPKGGPRSVDIIRKMR